MAKITLIDGTVIEGTIEELAELSAKLGADSLTFKGAEYTLVQRRAQPGDVVVFTKSTSLCVTNGKPYGPVFESRGDLGFTGDVGTTYDVYYGHYNRTVDNVKVYAPVAEAETLKEETKALRVGDYAKVAAHVRHDGYAGAGDIVTLHSNDGGCFDFKVVKLSDTSDYTLFDRGDLVKATDEEVAEAEQFAKLGRKPSEFKKGDIVRVLNASGTLHKTGDVGEITEFDGDKVFRVKTARIDSVNWVSIGDVELIAPVESRVDQ